MASRQNVLLTAEEYRSLPEDGPRYELIQGELHVAPAPNLYHQRIVGNLAFLLRMHLEQTKAGELYHAPVDVFLSDHDVVQPDLVFVEQARLIILAPEGIRGAPTLIIEILSSTTQLTDRTTKRELYTVAGVEELWLVDPYGKQIEIYRLREHPDSPISVFGVGQRLHSVCLPSLDLDCAAVFK